MKRKPIVSASVPRLAQKDHAGFAMGCAALAFVLGLALLGGVLATLI